MLSETRHPPARVNLVDARITFLFILIRTRSALRVAYRFVADIDAPLVKQVFNISERKREPNIQHHRQADDLRARLEVAKGRGLGHAQTLSRPPARLKPV